MFGCSTTDTSGGTTGTTGSSGGATGNPIRAETCCCHIITAAICPFKQMLLTRAHCWDLWYADAPTALTVCVAIMRATVQAQHLKNLACLLVTIAMPTCLSAAQGSIHTRHVLCPAATPTDCLLDQTRVLSIATSFGFTIFVLVYVAAAFSGKQSHPATSSRAAHTSCSSQHSTCALCNTCTQELDNN